MFDKTGLIQQPCLTPNDEVNFGDIIPFTITEYCGLAYIDFMIL